MLWQNKTGQFQRSSMRHRFLVIALMGVSACMPNGTDVFSDVIEPFEVEAELLRGEGPPDADPNACYGRHTTPAVIETITEQVAEPGGTFVTETRARIVEERRELWFETPCQAETDPDFITALQRALEARGLYRGPINGDMTRRTRRAIRDFQAPQGLDSPILSLAAARQLGLSLWDPEMAARGGGG